MPNLFAENLVKDIIDLLHDTLAFRTDTEIVPAQKMREIIASTKR